MTAFNAVRFKVKPGREQEFLDAHKKVQANWPGLKHANMIKTGDRAFCIIAEWTDMDALANARPHMIATLDSFRGTLEDLGGGLGVTDLLGRLCLHLNSHAAMSANDPKRTSRRSRGLSLLRSGSCCRRLVERFNFIRFSVMPGRLCAQVLGSCLITHLTSDSQT